MLTLAGCTGGLTATDSTPTSSTEPGDDRPASIPDDIEVIEYADLSDTQQQAFDQALSYGTIEFLDGAAWGVPEGYYSYSAVYESWPGETTEAGEKRTEAFVQRNGTYYRVSFDGPRCCTGPGIDPSLTEIDSPGNRTVTPLSNLSSRASAYLKYRITEDEHKSGYQVELPLENGAVVEYQDTYYEVTGIGRVVDYGTASMSVIERE